MSDPVIVCKMQVVYMPVFRLPQTTFKPTRECIPLSHHNHHRHHHEHSNHTNNDQYDRRRRNVDIDIVEYVVDEEEESSY